MYNRRNESMDLRPDDEFLCPFARFGQTLRLREETRL